MALELDHVFAFVDPADDWVGRLAAAGWPLDDGTEHQGQGTRNRRLPLAEQFVELLWLSSRPDAEANALRLDRRADWRMTGACPLGIGLRGRLADDEQRDFWAYRPPYAPGMTIWIHGGSEAQPLVFVMEVERAPRALPALRSVVLELPIAPQALLGRVTPRLTWRPATRPRLEVVVGNGASPLDVSETLRLIG